MNKLDVTSASVLRTVSEVLISLVSAMIAIIFDTGASMSISGELRNFLYGIDKRSTRCKELDQPFRSQVRVSFAGLFQSWEVVLLRLNV